MYLIVILKNISNFLILKILNLDVNNALQTIYWIKKNPVECSIMRLGKTPFYHFQNVVSL